jgi:uncharacterized protein
MSPSPSVDVAIDVEATMRDGTVLRADVYRPPSGGPWPVLLVRTPYDKQDPDILALLDPQAAVRRGYLVVIQDTRGRYRSEGSWEPLIHESDDGYDTVRWAARLPGANGIVGMYGPSYLGHVQWAALIAQPPELAAIVPEFTWSDPYDGLVARGGAYELGLITQWSSTLGSDVLPRDHTGQPIGPPFPRIADGLASIAAPTLTVAGWYDAFLQGSLDTYTGARDTGHPAALIVGPWSHNNQTSHIGETDFGAEASAGDVYDGSSLLSMELDWLDRHLKPLKPDHTTTPPPSSPLPPSSPPPPILIFVMGINEWRHLDHWPPPAVDTSWYLHTNSTLSETAPQPDEPADTYRHDPNNPVPTCGGALLLTDEFPAGPFDQHSIENRSDVLVYTSEPLENPLEVIGRVRAHIVAASTAPSIDWVVRLCDVDTNGISRNITDGILRAATAHAVAATATTATPREHSVDLWSTAHVFLPGHRIRLHIASSSFPRWDLNPSDRPATASVYHDTLRPSRIVLPQKHRRHTYS